MLYCVLEVRYSDLYISTVLSRRIYKGYFRDDFPTVISALDYLWGGGKMKFYLIVNSLPGDNPYPPSGPILDPTE